MAPRKGEWNEALLDRLKEVIEGLEPDKIRDAVTNNLDMEEVVKEIMDEDDEVKAAIRKKLKAKILEAIKELDPEDVLGNLDDDDVRAMAKELFDEEPEVKQALKDRVKKLALEEIGVIEQLSDLDDDFSWSEILPEDFLADTLEKMFEDEEGALPEKVKALIIAAIKGLTAEDVIPDDQEEFLKLLDLDEAIKKVLAEEELQEILVENLREVLKAKLGDLEEDDLPEDFMDGVDLSKQIAAVMGDHSFQDELKAALRQVIISTIQRLATQSGTGLAEKITDNRRVTALIEDTSNEVLDDSAFRDSLRESLKRRIKTDTNIGSNLINALMEKISVAMVDRLLSALRP